MKIKKVLITGSTGCIGIALVNLMTDLNIEVTAIVRPSSARLKLLKKSALVKVVECDISDLNSLHLEKCYALKGI